MCKCNVKRTVKLRWRHHLYVICSTWYVWLTSDGVIMYTSSAIDYTYVFRVTPRHPLITGQIIIKLSNDNDIMLVDYGESVGWGRRLTLILAINKLGTEWRIGRATAKQTERKRNLSRRSWYGKGKWESYGKGKCLQRRRRWSNSN